MLEILGQSTGNIIATRITQTLSAQDYSKILPLIIDRFRQYQKIRWYFLMEDFHGWNLCAFWKDVAIDLDAAKNFEKISIIGEKNWEDWMRLLMKPYTNADIKFFETEAKDVAWQWLVSKDQPKNLPDRDVYL